MELSNQNNADPESIQKEAFKGECVYRHQHWRRVTLDLGRQIQYILTSLKDI